MATRSALRCASDLLNGFLPEVHQLVGGLAILDLVFGLHLLRGGGQEGGGNEQGGDRGLLLHLRGFLSMKYPHADEKGKLYGKIGDESLNRGAQ
jgi:hypothetical protein